jgi:hypothetical protein
MDQIAIPPIFDSDKVSPAGSISGCSETGQAYSEGRSHFDVYQVVPKRSNLFLKDITSFLRDRASAKTGLGLLDLPTLTGSAESMWLVEKVVCTVRERLVLIFQYRNFKDTLSTIKGERGCEKKASRRGGRDEKQAYDKILGRIHANKDRINPAVQAERRRLYQAEKTRGKRLMLVADKISPGLALFCGERLGNQMYELPSRIQIWLSIVADEADQTIKPGLERCRR